MAGALLQKYPNSKNDRVKTIDMLGCSKQLLQSNEHLVIDRLMGTKWDVPSWVLKFAGIRKEALVRETFAVCPERQLLINLSENVFFCNLIKVEETLVYRHSQ